MTLVRVIRLSIQLVYLAHILSEKKCHAAREDFEGCKITKYLNVSLSIKAFILPKREFKLVNRRGDTAYDEFPNRFVLYSGNEFWGMHLKQKDKKKGIDDILYAYRLPTERADAKIKSLESKIRGVEHEPPGDYKFYLAYFIGNLKIITGTGGRKNTNDYWCTISWLKGSTDEVSIALRRDYPKSNKIALFPHKNGTNIFHPLTRRGSNASAETYNVRADTEGEIENITAPTHSGTGDSYVKAIDLIIQTSDPENKVSIWRDGFYSIYQSNKCDDVMWNTPKERTRIKTIEVVCEEYYGKSPMMIGLKHGHLYAIFLVGFIAAILIAFVCINFESEEKPKITDEENDEI